MDIRFEQVDFTYQPNTPFEQRALFDLNLTIEDGSYTAIVGHTGSGKSTLLQHLNALVKPTKGKVMIGDRTIIPETNNKNLKPIRKKLVSFFSFQKLNYLKKQLKKILLLDLKISVLRMKKGNVW
ncbi:ATP-binding cassette domain-containing protein [Enterococcus termitis]